VPRLHHHTGAGEAARRAAGGLPAGRDELAVPHRRVARLGLPAAARALGAAGACLALSRRTVSSITLLGCGRRAAVVTCGLSGRPRARTYALCDLYMPHPDQLEQNYKKHLYVRGHYLPLMVEAHAPLMDVRGMAELGVVKDFKEAEPRDYYDLQ